MIKNDRKSSKMIKKQLKINEIDQKLSKNDQK